VWSKKMRRDWKSSMGFGIRKKKWARMGTERIALVRIKSTELKKRSLQRVGKKGGLFRHEGGRAGRGREGRKEENWSSDRKNRAKQMPLIHYEKEKKIIQPLFRELDRGKGNRKNRGRLREVESSRGPSA